MRLFGVALAINWIYVVSGVVAVLSIISVIVRVHRNTCFFGHRKKRFIAMDLHGSKNSQGKFVPHCYCWSTRNDMVVI